MTTPYKCKCHPHSAFHWMRDDYPQKISWSHAQKAADHSAISSNTVNAKRAYGVDVATIHGLSKAKQAHKIDPKRFHVYSKAKPKAAP